MGISVCVCVCVCVCLSVCLSVHKHISGTTCTDLTFLVCVAWPMAMARSSIDFSDQTLK